MTTTTSNGNDPHRNVGTQGYPVTWLHERAIALLYDELQEGLLTRAEVRVRLNNDGEFSDNLLDGVASVKVPSDLTPIGGMQPDLALYDQSGEPVRTIEVVVTSPPDAGKVKRLKERGVDVVIVRVESADVLKNLCWVPKSLIFSRNIRFDPPEGGSVFYPRIDKREQQSRADHTVEELTKSLIRCSPKVRRDFLEVLKGIDSLESFCPVSPNNPKKDILQE